MCSTTHQLTLWTSVSGDKYRGMWKSAYSVCLDSMPVKCVAGGSVDMVVSHPISYESSQEGGYV